VLRATSPSNGLPRRWVPERGSHYVLWLLTLVVVVGPVVPVVWASFWSTPLYEGGGSATLQNYRHLLSDDTWWVAVGNSALFAAMTTAGSTVVGVGLAVLLVRTDLPLRRLFGAVFVLPVVLPGLVLLVGWSVMWSPSGYVSAWLQAHGTSLPIDLYSIPGMALVATSVAAPIIYLFVRGSLGSMDSSLEQAARCSGAGPLRALVTVTLPLLRPVALNSGMIVFALALEVLGLPLILGSSSGTTLMSTYLYDHWVKAQPPDQGLVAAAGVLLLLIVSALLFARDRLVGDSARFATTGGKAHGTSPLQLGPARWVISAGVGLGMACFILVPLAGVFLSAFTSFLSPFLSPWSLLTTSNFDTIFSNRTYTASIVNSLLIAGVGGFLATVAVAVLSMVAHRSQFRRRHSLQQAMLWPRAVPGLVTGMGFFWAFAVLNPSGSLRSSLWVMGLAFAVRALALGYSAFYPALTVLGKDLDLAARSAGAGWWTAMRTIILRLVQPAFGVAFVLLFVAMLNDADPAVFLVTPDTPVMGFTMLQLAQTGTGGFVAAFGVLQMAITLVVLGAGRLLLGVRPHA